MSAPVQARVRGVQGRYRVGSLDLVDLEVDSPAGGSDTVETRCERCRVGSRVSRIRVSSPTVFCGCVVGTG